MYYCIPLLLPKLMMVELVQKFVILSLSLYLGKLVGDNTLWKECAKHWNIFLISFPRIWYNKKVERHVCNLGWRMPTPDKAIVLMCLSPAVVVARPWYSTSVGLRNHCLLPHEPKFGPSKTQEPIVEPPIIRIC